MKNVSLSELKDKLEECIDYVREHGDSVVVSGPDGDCVRIVPIAKPVDEWKGRPVYKLRDVQYIDFPY